MGQARLGTVAYPDRECSDGDAYYDRNEHRSDAIDELLNRRTAALRLGDQ